MFLPYNIPIFIYKKHYIMKASRFILIFILNRISQEIETAYLGNNKKVYNLSFNEICEQNYNINPANMEIQFNLNFK